MAAGPANREFLGAGKWDLKVKMKVKLREVAEGPFPGPPPPPASSRERHASAGGGRRGRGEARDLAADWLAARARVAAMTGAVRGSPQRQGPAALRVPAGAGRGIWHR